MLHRTKGIISVVFTALAFLIIAQVAAAEVNDDYALKISLESQLERKLKQVIMEITGTDRVVVFVNADLVSKGGAVEKKKTNAFVLPGVPEKKEYGTGQSEMLIGAGSSKYAVNKIVLSLWIDKSVPSSIVDLSTDIAKNVIGYNQSRGDQINIKKVDFESKGFFRSLIALPNLFWFILTGLGGFMLVTMGMFLMNPLKKVVPALKEIDWSQIRGGGNSTTIEMTAPTALEREVVSGVPAQAAPGAAGTQPEEGQLPFSFIRERDLPSLGFLLKDKAPQEIAIVVNYLDPAIATRLLDLFPKERQVEVAIVLGHEEINLDKVHALEAEIKKNLTFVVGGESKLLTLLDMANEEVRDSVVKKLEATDAKAGARVKQRIKSLENILSELHAAGIQTVYRNVDATSFAQVLKSLPAEVQQKVLSALSAGMAERLKQEMDLSRPLSAIRLKREKQNLMVRVRRLLSEGLVEVENS